MGTDADGWRLAHRAPSNDGYHAPLSGGGDLWPEDVYERPGDYVRIDGTDLYTTAQRESFAVMARVRGNPDALVTVWRACPAEYVTRGIRAGDWVTTSRTYALLHGAGMGPDGEDWPIIERTVRAGELFSEANDFCEYGYDPEGRP